MTTYTDAQDTLPVHTEVDHGVLVATIRTKSLLYEMAINEIEECILAAMPKAKSALLVDCGELTLHVSSQFLSMLVRVHRKASESGLKMGICDLSEALQLVYNVTALKSVLPAYESRHQAVADLGEFDVWENRPIRDLDDEVAKSRPSSATRFTWQLALIGTGIVGGALLILTMAIGLLRDRPSPPEPPIFRSSVQGRITYLVDGQSHPDANAMVIAWPIERTSDRKINPEQYLRAQNEGWIDVQNGILLGRVDSAGAFNLPALIDAGQTGYHLLVVSGQVQSQKPIPDHDQLLLSQCLTDPKKTLGDRAFTTGRVQVGAAGNAQFDWAFASGQH